MDRFDIHVWIISIILSILFAWSFAIVFWISGRNYVILFVLSILFGIIGILARPSR